MPIPSPFHPRTAAVCESHEWRDWSGYLAAGVYEPTHEREYFAIRNAAALIDVTPLFKYEIEGPQAARAVDRIMPRAVAECPVGYALYAPWCDEWGKVVDDGIVARLSEDRFRITAAHRNLRWFQDVAYGFDARVKDVSRDIAAVALQGPNSRSVLGEIVEGFDPGGLDFFHLARGRIGEAPVTVTRTGYTGDLGYEIWTPADAALSLWDALVATGRGYGLLPAGMVALDIARIEAGLLLIDVDYKSTRHARVEAQKSSPYELGLGWAVALDDGDFVGRDALRREKMRGAAWAMVGVFVAWEELETLYAEEGLPPAVAGRASRDAVPLYQGDRQVGQITSHTFSPILKKYIGIGSIRREFAAPGTAVQVEVTVEYKRKRAGATVVKTPFYDPPHKRR